MNQSDHRPGIVDHPTSGRQASDGYNQYAATLKWARAFYENSVQPICLADPESLQVFYVNPAFLLLTGKVHEVRYGSLEDLFSNETFREVKKILASVNQPTINLAHAHLAFDERKQYDLKLERHEVECRFLSISIWPSFSGRPKIEEQQLFNPGGQVNFPGPVDLTLKKAIEDTLLSESEELNKVVSSLDDVVFEYDVEGNFKKLWCNNEAVLLLMPKEYVGKSLRDAYHANPQLTGPFIEDFENAIANKEICYRDFELAGVENSSWFSSKITPLFDSEGKAKGFSQRITDISEQKKVDLAVSEKNLQLKLAHRELKEIIENTSEIIFKLDHTNRVIFVSPEFERTLGYPGSEMVGLNIADLIHQEFREVFQLELEKARNNTNSFTNKIYKVVTHDGKDRWFNITAKFLLHEKPESVTGIVFAKDITHLKVTMDSLAASEERYRSVVNSLSEGVVMHDCKGHIVACNLAAERIFDLERGGALGDTLRKPDLRAVKEDGSVFPLHEFPAMITLNTGVPVKNVVMGVYKRDGDIAWLMVNTEPVHYKAQGGNPDGVVASLIDITEQKRARELLTENNRKIQEYSNRLTGVLGSITDGFIAVDSELNITLWNKVIENITGIRETDAVGKKLADLKTYMIDDAAFESCQYAIAHKTAVSFEQYVPALDHWFETSAYHFVDGLFLYFRDITNRKLQENLLALEKRVLEINATQVTSLKETVDHFLNGLEDMFPGMLCSVLTLDEDGVSMRNLSAPSLPQSFTHAIDGEQIGPNAGSCGTAMYTKNRIIVSDISTDYLWADYRELAASHNLQSCWSFPIKNAQNEILATIATYYRHVATPNIFQLQILERVQNLLKIIIENKIAESRIRISNERYLLATRATNDAIWDYDLVSNSLYHGEGYASIFGYKVGRKPPALDEWQNKIHPEDRERVVTGFDGFILSNSHKHWESEYRYLRADGKYVLVYDRGFLIFNQEGKVVRIIGSMQDITEKKQLEKRVLKQELDRQKLVAQAVVDAQEKERAEIGKELHDNVNQILSTAKLYLELARSDEKERLSLISRSAENIFNAINEIRAISRSLVPPSIGDLGIIESINDLIENVRATKQLHAEFYYTPGIEVLINEKQQLMLFRIIQEQVNNVLKHAEASNLIIELMIDANIVDLTISDNGKGFDKENNKKRGVGLSNIASRTELFNGYVNLITAPGKGCTLNIHIPITND